MTIFFDTTELKENPLFYNNPMEIFFELSKAGKITIYISEIVLYELKKHYIVDFKEKLNSYNEKSKKFHKFWDNKYNEKIYSDNKIKSNFTKRINKLTKDNYFTVAKFDHKNIINSMLDRYIESKAPFHEINKSRENKNNNNWKDYIIWESYKEIINNNEEQYIFISNNIYDFSNNKADVNTDEGNYRGHDDFYKDIRINNENLKFYRKINGFIKENKEYQKIYIEYLINKYNSNNEDISIIEELLSFTSKYVNIFSYKENNEPYYIKNINKNSFNNKNIVDVYMEYNNQVKDKKDVRNNTRQQGNKSITENGIETKCTFIIDIQNLTFSIDLIEGFKKVDNKNL